LAAIGLLITTTSCFDEFTIDGNGNEATENRVITEFDELKSSGSFNVHITNGDVYEVIVIAESNIIPYIETYVSNGRLNLNIRGLHNVRNRLPMQVFVTTPEMKSIIQSGSGQISTGYFEANEFELYVSGSGSITTAVDATVINAGISGSGKINVSGTATYANYNVNGSGRIDSYDLETSNCDARISGSGDVYVFANDFIKATISGSGNVYYLGNPTLETHVSGSGRIIADN
jgi:hypothetical protein